MENYNGIISLLFACLELLLLINLLFFSQKNETNKLAIGMIFLLFMYQLTEFLICFFELKHQFIIYAAFVFITLLPPLGLYFVLRFLNKYNAYTKYIFLPALFFIFYYLFVIDNFVVSQCTLLYAIYNYPFGDLYGFFYYLPILITIIILGASYKSENQTKKQSLIKILLFGYLFTFIPLLLLIIITPQLINAVESILCKFAFIFAVCLTLFILKNKQDEKGEYYG